LIFKDEYDVSLLPKIIFITAISCVSLLVGSLMFIDKTSLPLFIEPYAIDGIFVRHILLMFCLLFYVLRLAVTVFVFLKRKMVWIEMFLVTVLMSFALFSIAKVGGNSSQPIGAIDYIGILLYLFGSWINTKSEYTRYIWKRNDANIGKLYTGGLFKYSMHINYFGDVLLFTGFVLITQSFTLLIIPLVMALNFIFYIIPTLDKYLGKKYGDEFIEYAKKTKKLIPGLY
jgi:protein-S-isoprenylcysteine O-methyltransferase Ste14